MKQIFIVLTLFIGFIGYDCFGQDFRIQVENRKANVKVSYNNDNMTCDVVFLDGDTTVFITSTRNKNYDEQYELTYALAKANGCFMRINYMQYNDERIDFIWKVKKALEEQCYIDFYGNGYTLVCGGIETSEGKLIADMAITTFAWLDR
jgi:hypothetical protein